VGEIVDKQVTLSVSGFSSTPDAVAAGDSQGGLGISRAFISMSALSLVPCEKAASTLVLEPRGYDLLTDVPPSELITTAVTDFCGLRFDIDPLSKNLTDGIPQGSSLYVLGKDADAADVTLQSDGSASLLFETDATAPFGAQPLLLGFDLSVWLDGLPLPEDMADDSAKLFVSQLVGSAALYVDANANQVLDEDELTPIATATAK
jgi:hypothetical protein